MAADASVPISLIRAPYDDLCNKYSVDRLHLALVSGLLLALHRTWMVNGRVRILNLEVEPTVEESHKTSLASVVLYFYVYEPIHAPSFVDALSNLLGTYYHHHSFLQRSRY